jgi:serine/threonine protein kinase
MASPGDAPTLIVDGLEYSLHLNHAFVKKLVSGDDPTLLLHVEIDRIEYTVEEIGLKAFLRSSILQITIPSTVRILGSRCFFMCEKLCNVEFAADSRLTTVDYEAFRGCGFSTISLPPSVQMLSRGVFQECESLRELCFGLGSRFFLISEDCCRGTRIESIQIPQAIDRVDKRAFHGCRYLTAVTFDDECKVTKLRSEAFYETPLISISVPRAVQLIGAQCFAGCRQLATVNIRRDSALETIEEGAFADCPLLELFLPKLLRTVERRAFPNVTKLILDASNEYFKLIGCNLYDISISRLVCSYSHNGNIVIPRTVEVLDGYCCTGLRDRCEIEFEANSIVMTIGAHSFIGSAIRIIEIPCMCEKIEDYAFAECRFLTCVRFEADSQLLSIGKYGFSSSGLTEITIPRKVRIINDHCFSGCRHLACVVFENESELESVCDYAFEGIALTMLTIPRRTRHVSETAFARNRIVRRDSDDVRRDSNCYDIGQCEKVAEITDRVNVWQHRVTKERFSVKTLRSPYKRPTDKSLDELCAREAECLRKICHPCIAGFVGYCPSTTQHGPRIVTRFVEGRSLADLLLDEDWDAASKAIAVAGIVSAMSHVHDHDILYRDLEPSNIIIDYERLPHLCDFGSSRLKLSAGPFTQKVGTPRYMAPEMYDSGEYTKKVDVFSFGLILYEIVSGEPVFPIRITLNRLMKQVIEGTRKPIPNFVPGWLGEIIAKCWQVDPTVRPAFSEIFDLLVDHDFVILNGVDKGRVIDAVRRLPPTDFFPSRFQAINGYVV